MKVILIDNGTKQELGTLQIQSQPHNNEWIEFEKKIFAIHRVIHTENGITLMVIPVR